MTKLLIIYIVLVVFGITGLILGSAYGMTKGQKYLYIMITAISSAGLGMCISSIVG